VVTDALGVLVIILVPIVMLRNLAIVISWWILAITVAELRAQSVVYYYLRAPDPEVVLLRATGVVQGAHQPRHGLEPVVARKATTMVFWLGLTVVGRVPHARPDFRRPDLGVAPGVERLALQRLHAHIQDKFGGVEPLIVVAEGKDRRRHEGPQVLAHHGELPALPRARPGRGLQLLAHRHPAPA